MYIYHMYIYIYMSIIYIYIYNDKYGCKYGRNAGSHSPLFCTLQPRVGIASARWVNDSNRKTWENSNCLPLQLTKLGLCDALMVGHMVDTWWTHGGHMVDTWWTHGGNAKDQTLHLDMHWGRAKMFLLVLRAAKQRSQSVRITLESQNRQSKCHVNTCTILTYWTERVSS